MRFDESDVSVSQQLESVIDQQEAIIKKKDFEDRADPDRTATRRAILHPNDAFALERILGQRDLMGINFLARGAQAAKPVCRIRVRDRHQNPHSMGSGFLVAPGLLMTNNHVIRNAQSAVSSLAEFDAELDAHYVPKKIRVYSLRPDLLFFTDSLLDFTFVAVATYSHDEIPLTDYGSLPLIQQSGKAIPGESVTVIQHPNGGLKQIVIRASQIVSLEDVNVGDGFIHYTSDTEPGSSGAPVLNDQWDVVAIHHKAVPRFNKKGKILSKSGEEWTEAMGVEEIDWLANEGVRISEIYRSLHRHAAGSLDARNVLAALGNDTTLNSRLGSSTLQSGSSEDSVPEGEPLEATSFDNADGYDPDFLNVSVPLPKVVAPWDDDVSTLIDGGTELKYRHFSAVMSTSRRLAYFVAVNIAGGQLMKPTKKPSWRIDKRLDKSLQINNVLYKHAEGETFDIQRGHLVRRLDPAWGDQDEVNEAVNHTYHYTNAAPQGADFNDDVWGDLEDFILKRAADTNHRVTIFSGPIFDDENDPFYREGFPGGPYQIPLEYWKVVVFEKPDGTMSATAYKQGQPEVRDFVERSFTRGFRPISEARRKLAQLKISDLEELTLIDFGQLKQFDPLQSLESTRASREVFALEDIVL